MALATLRTAWCRVSAQVLDLSNCSAVSDSTLMHIASRCSAITELQLSTCAGVTDRALMLVAGYPDASLRTYAPSFDNPGVRVTFCLTVLLLFGLCCTWGKRVAVPHAPSFVARSDAVTPRGDRRTRLSLPRRGATVAADITAMQAENANPLLARAVAFVTRAEGAAPRWPLLAADGAVKSPRRSASIGSMSTRRLSANGALEPLNRPPTAASCADGASVIPHSLTPSLPAPYSLLPTPYSLLPTPYSLTPSFPTPYSYSLLPTPYSLLPTPSASRPLPLPLYFDACALTPACVCCHTQMRL